MRIMDTGKKTDRQGKVAIGCLFKIMPDIKKV
jgi:hypothetical protein